MKTRHKHDSLRGLALAAAGLVLGGLFLESRGVATWAERLEVGRGREAALTFSRGLSLATEWTRAPRLRTVLNGRLEGKPPAAPAAAVPAPAAPVPAAPEPARVLPALQVHDASDAGDEEALPVLAAERPMTVALVGDSMMAVGVGPNLARAFNASGNIKVVKAFRSGTGLIRPDVFNWPEEIPRLIGSHRPDVYICFMGANDAQDTLLEGKLCRFGCEAWIREYQQRVRNLLAAMPRDQAQPLVVWIGLPRMRSEKFSRKIIQVNAIVRAGFEGTPNLLWVDSNPLLAPGDSYVEYLQDRNNRLVQIRADDGIHFTNAGALRIARGVLKRMQALHAPGQAG